MYPNIGMKTKGGPLSRAEWWEETLLYPFIRICGYKKGGSDSVQVLPSPNHRLHHRTTTDTHCIPSEPLRSLLRATSSHPLFIPSESCHTVQRILGPLEAMLPLSNPAGMQWTHPQRPLRGPQSPPKRLQRKGRGTGGRGRCRVQYNPTTISGPISKGPAPLGHYVSTNVSVSSASHKDHTLRNTLLTR